MSRAVQFDEYGDADVLRVREVPRPLAGPDEILVRVVAAGLNPFDSKVRSGVGNYRSDGPFPRGVGQDFAGRVAAAPNDARYADGSVMKVGDEVIGWADRRSMADEVVVTAAELVRKPAELSWDVAGAVPTPARTAATSLELLAIGPGDVLLVGAVAGGVGGLLAQLAVARGAAVIGTCGLGSADYVRSLGVGPVVYGPGLVDRVRETGLVPTVAVDCHGRDVVDAALELGVAPSRVQTIVRHDVTHELGLANPGFPERTAAGLESILREVVAARVEIPVRAYPVSDVVDAFRELDAGHVRGKLVVRFD